jgi:hypothetical protein
MGEGEWLPSVMVTECADENDCRLKRRQRCGYKTAGDTAAR